jgi:hypothetical protein
MNKDDYIKKEQASFSNQMDPECVAQSQPAKLNIVGVKYEDKFEKKTFSGREYSYYSDIDLEIGDIVEVPTRYGKSIAQVTRTNIDEKEIEKIKDYMKIIETKIDKEQFLNGGNE